MEGRPLSLVIALLIIAGVIAGGWCLLSRPVSESPIGPGTSDVERGGLYEDSGTYHDISGSYPTSTSIRDAAGKEAALTLMRSYVEEEANRFKKETVDVITSEDVALLGLSDERKYVLAITYKVYESPQTVSYVFQIYADTLGAHGNGYYRTFTFRKDSGAALPLEQLFLSGEYPNILSEKTREKVATALGEGNYDREYLEAGTTPDADNFQNFYLEDDTLVIIFPPYQVGPWVIGTQEAPIPRAELGTILREEYR